MPLPTSRVQKTATGQRRPLTQEEILLRVLNGDVGPSGRPIYKAEVNQRRLQVIVLRFQRLEEVLKSDSYSPELPYDPYSENPAIVKAFLALNRILVRYRLTPRVLPDYRFGVRPLGWDLSYAEAHKTQELFEFARVRHIEKIAAEGRISYLKQCAHCRRWLFAKFSHQRFCGDQCKEGFHRTDVTDKARRRDWARKNYWLHKNKNTK